MIFEKKAVSFDEFIGNTAQEKVDEGAFKNIALATLLGASSLAGMAGNKQGDGTKMKYLDVKSEKVMQNYLKLGWTLDSTSVDKYIDGAVETKEIQGDIYKIDLGQGFGSGLFDLNDDSKGKIDSSFDQIYADGSIVTKVGIESSTDKTPISARMTAATGIKDNTDLSERRAGLS